ncbi:MAG: hypothetical protein GF331_09225, partial [Chitinivibrionales bacterium]|nr:hypothetical protein [Chitinivibrionales bacterium]
MPDRSSAPALVLALAALVAHPVAQGLHIAHFATYDHPVGFPVIEDTIEAYVDLTREPAIAAIDVSTRIAGLFVPAYSEVYTISARVVGMPRIEANLWVEGELVATQIHGSNTDWTFGGPSPRALSAGEPCRIRLEVIRSRAGQPQGSVELFWQSAGQARERIPTSALRPGRPEDRPSFENCGGSILRELWLNTPGTAPSSIPVGARPNGVDRLAQLRAQSWEEPHANTDAGDNYGQRIRGFLTPYEDGEYDFWISGDEQAELYLSYTPDATGIVSGEVINKTRIAWVTQPTGVDEWNRESFQRAGNNVGAITLERGRMYYIEVLHKEAAGSDHVSVGWRRPSDGPGATPSQVIPGVYLSPIPQFPVSAHPCKQTQAHLDLMKQSRTMRPLGIDSMPARDPLTGWPIDALPFSGNGTLSWPVDTYLRNGEYVISWDGDGEVDIRLTSSTVTSRSPNRLVVNISDHWVWPWIKTSNPADPVRNIRIIQSEYADSYDPAAPFHPLFLATFEGVRTIRFMGWQSMNSSHEVRWGDRTNPEWFANAGKPFTDVDGEGDVGGTALEHCVDLCNATGADGWFCVPHAADSGYMRNMAQLLRDRMAPSLKVYIEYSNETWNFGPGFDQFHAIMGNNGAKFEWFGDSIVAPHEDGNIFERTAWLSNRMFGVFEDAFSQVAAGNRPELVRVVALQTNGTQQPEWLWRNVGTQGDAGFDAIAPSGYFAGHSDIPRSDLSDGIGNGTYSVAQATELYFERAEGRHVGYGEQVRRYIDNMQEQCNCEIDYLQYESGEHLTNYQEGERGPAYDLLA